MKAAPSAKKNAPRGDNSANLPAAKPNGKIRILVLGACGKMGREVLSLLENDACAKAVCGVDSCAEEYAATAAAQKSARSA